MVFKQTKAISGNNDTTEGDWKIKARVDIKQVGTSKLDMWGGQMSG